LLEDGAVPPEQSILRTNTRTNKEHSHDMAPEFNTQLMSLVNATQATLVHKGAAGQELISEIPVTTTNR
jgi:hypothetical protein